MHLVPLKTALATAEVCIIAKISWQVSAVCIIAG